MSVYHAVYPFVQTALIANVPCVMDCWSGSRPLTLVHQQNWTPAAIPFQYPAIALGHGPTGSIPPVGGAYSNPRYVPRWELRWSVGPVGTIPLC